MISHEHKLIFIHIPKCAGSSIKNHIFGDIRMDWKTPNYELLYGWCPKRKIHLQHATAKQLLEMDLIKEEIWNEYFKFTIVRNPWDRAYSDYLWIMQDRNIKGSFRQYITKTGDFEPYLTNSETMDFRGDHLIPQTDFFSQKGKLKMDFVGSFENLAKDMTIVNQKSHLANPFDSHEKNNKNRLSHYSLFYTKSRKELVDHYYSEDIEQLNYSFEDLRKGFRVFQKYL